MAVARHADACLARGDAGAALAALSPEPFSTCGELQVFARLAAAWMAAPLGSRRARFRKTMALLRFLALHDEKRPEERKVIPLPGATWSEAKLDEVAAGARAWLDAQR